jgi:serine/threonine protein kinase
VPSRTTELLVDPSVTPAATAVTGIPPEAPYRHGFPAMHQPPPPCDRASRSPGVVAFLAALRRSQLLSDSQWSRVEAAVPPSANTPVLAARALVSAGLLTKFQAERLLAGRTDGFLLGSYVILEQIGCGLIGRVYKARHRTMNRVVAVKVISADLTRTAAARQALQKEARAAAQLNHPNVVTTFDANELAERFYVVREFVDGPNLDTLVRERGRLPVSEACELVRQAAEGLDHAHAQGTVHGDIRPANLLVGRPSKSVPGTLLKLADFGFARFRPPIVPPTPSTPLELVHFAAPEQVTHPTVLDPRTDLYSLGAVLYFLLAGRPPLPGPTAEESLRRLLWEVPPPLDAVRPDVPPSLAQLVQQLLAKDPAQRPSSAAEVARRLDAVLVAHGEAVSFDLPALAPGPYSFVAGQLSGSHAAATGETLPNGVIAYPGGTYTTAPTAESSAWSDLTATTADEPAPLAPLIERRSRGRSSETVPLWLSAAVAGGILLLSLAAIGVLFRLFGR